jgi:Zn-dependent peptidase ImmA (M78 family)/transcriptional regulator with XRE-family HTH domain
MRTHDFVGARLRVARRFHGLSQTELGRKVAASSTMLSQVEAGTKKPSDLLVQAFSDVLAFQPGFFFEPLVDEYKDEECNFRRRKTSPAYLRRRVLAHGTLLSLVVSYLETVLTFPIYRVPRCSARTINDIEAAADQCRAEWGLGSDLPLTNVVRSLENAGVVVTRIWADTEKVDAFSRPGRRGAVVLAGDKNSGSRSIFDAAHELGHLVMHVGLPADSPEVEQQADYFAGALLLPRDGFIREFRGMGHRLHWPFIFELKRRWRCSAAAILTRAYQLQLINAAEYRQGHRYMRLKGWHKGEPVEPPIEQPELLSIALAALWQATGESAYDLSRRLYLEPKVLEKVTGLPVPVPAEPLPGVASLDEYRRKRATT